MRIHPLITKSDDLKALVDRLSKQPFIAVDTEFMRENTYWPDLCLIQVASIDEAAAIDPKADIDLKPLLDLFVKNEDVLKVFHAGGQDLEIIHNLTGKVPHPLFDTQIAAMALGHGEQIGYSNLIESLLGHSLDKGARFTDWGRRPLDKSQIDYAIADVTHLATVFPRMVEKLKKTGRGAWLDEEMERLADPSSFAFPPEDAWKRLKLPSRNPAVLGRLKALAAWRETEARTKNLPRGRIIKDDTLNEIVLHPPKNQDDLGRVRGLSAGWRTNDIGARLIAAIAAAKPLEPDELPDREPRRPGPDQGGRAGQRPVQAAAQDPRQGNRGRGAADRAIGRPRGACRRRSQEPQYPLAAGATSNSARTRSTWSKAASPSRSSTASSR